MRKSYHARSNAMRCLSRGYTNIAPSLLKKIATDMADLEIQVSALMGRNDTLVATLRSLRRPIVSVSESPDYITRRSLADDCLLRIREALISDRKEKQKDAA